MQFSDSDLNTFMAAFGCDGSYNGVAIRMIFSRVFHGVDASGAVIEGYAPNALVKASDVVGIANGTIVYVETSPYLVTGIEDNDDGFLRLFLAEAT